MFFRVVCSEDGQDPQGQKAPNCFKTLVFWGILCASERSALGRKPKWGIRKTPFGKRRLEPFAEWVQELGPPSLKRRREWHQTNPQHSPRWQPCKTTRVVEKRRPKIHSARSTQINGNRVLSLRPRPPMTGVPSGPGRKVPHGLLFRVFGAPGSECPKECFLSTFWHFWGSKRAKKHWKSTLWAKSTQKALRGHFLAWAPLGTPVNGGRDRNKIHSVRGTREEARAKKGPKVVTAILKYLVDVSDIYYYFFSARGRGRESEAPGRGGGRFSIEIPGGGGGSPRTWAPRTWGWGRRVCAGNLGGGG